MTEDGVTFHCGTCGWPGSSRDCAMCGRPVGAPGFTADSILAGDASRLQPEDFPELEAAFAAWKERDWQRMVQLSLAAEGIIHPSQLSRSGVIGWLVTVDSAVMYVTLDSGRSELVVESPLVWVGETRRVPLFRALLEMNANALGAARFCVRGDMVILRFVDHIANLSPPKLVLAVREVGILADRYDNWLAEGFSARMIGPVIQQSGMGWHHVGTPVELARLHTDAGTGGTAAGPESTGLARLLHDGTQLLQRFAPERTGPVAALIVRAVVCRAEDEFNFSHPGAVAVLRDCGRELFADAPVRGTQIYAAASKIAFLCEEAPRLVELGGTSPAIPPLGKHLKEHVRERLTSIESGPDDPALHSFVLFGALTELLVRGDQVLPQRAIHHLRNMMAKARRSGDDARTAAFLMQVARKLAK